MLKLLTGKVNPHPLPTMATAFTEKPSGLIIWTGLSLLDGKTPIEVTLTGLKSKSNNAKTGRVLQTWIQLANIDPRDAIRDGRDAPICGDCKHMARCVDCGTHAPFHEGARCPDCGGEVKRPCYVKVQHGPTTVYKVRNGIKGPWARNPWYAMATPADLEQIKGLDAVIRFGAYGDPAAVPTRVWESLAELCPRFMGYTHQWRTCDPNLKRYCMASVDSPKEYAEAVSMGWRTFRVRAPWQKLDKAEAVCPASEEAGKKAVCADCTLCMGTQRKAKHIAIIAHGIGARAFLQSVKTE